MRRSLERLFACEIARSSLPIELRQDHQLDAKYGAPKTPKPRLSAAAPETRACRAACRIGSDAINGSRAGSQASMVVRAPSRGDRPAREAEHRPGAISTASDQPIFDGDPVVTSTNHGTARYVIREPRIEQLIRRLRVDAARASRARVERVHERSRYQPRRRACTPSDRPDLSRA